MPKTGRQPITPVRLEEIAADLQTKADRLKWLATQMKKKGVKSVEVMNQTTAASGQTAIGRLINSCDSALESRINSSNK